MGFRIEHPASIVESSSVFVENGLLLLYEIGSKGTLNLGGFSFWGFEVRLEYEAIAWKDEQDLEFKRSCFLSAIIIMTRRLATSQDEGLTGQFSVQCFHVDFIADNQTSEKNEVKARWTQAHAKGPARMPASINFAQSLFVQPAAHRSSFGTFSL